MDSVLNGLPNHIRVTGLDIPHTTPGRFPELSLQNKQPPARHLRVEVGNTAVNTGIDMEINDVANPQLSRRIPELSRRQNPAQKPTSSYASPSYATAAAALPPPSSPYLDPAPNPPPSYHLPPQLGHSFKCPSLIGTTRDPQNGHGSTIHTIDGYTDV